MRHQVFFWPMIPALHARRRIDTMRLLLGSAATVLLAAAGSAAIAAPTLKGDYVEARTCNVYIGACHANGEKVTSGREAIMAWNITGGEVDGYKMAGLKAV